MFYSAIGNRPIRLSEETRRLAYEYRCGKYGDMAAACPAVIFDASEISSMAASDLYNAAILKIARTAPLRILDNELLSGSATLGLAIKYFVPATSEDRPLLQSVSHLTPGFERVLKSGISGIEREIDAEYEKAGDQREKEFLKGLKNAALALRIFHKRYVDALSGEKRELLERVPIEPAADFKTALQALWFTFAFERLVGNWPGIGRIDAMLGPYLEKDLALGRISLDEAREYIAHFFIKGCEWTLSDAPKGSGDAQHYQNIVLGGTGPDGREVTNAVTYLVLDVVEELGISDFPITVRLNKNTPEQLYRKVAQVMRHGGGTVAVYSEKTVVKALLDFGVTEDQVYSFANDGCWEVQIPGRTCFSYMPFDSLRILLDTTLDIGNGGRVYESYQSLFDAYMSDLKEFVYGMIESADRSRTVYTEKGFEPVDFLPCCAVSLLEQDCIKNHKGYYGGGPMYTVLSPHIGGAPDTANSLYAIKKLVFDDKRVSFAELMKALEANWEGYEPLRLWALNKYKYYGTDSDEADGIYVSLMNGFGDICNGYECKGHIKYPAGASTFGRQIEWAPYRRATPFGAKAGEILSGNLSPTPGTDLCGATAAIRSYCKADLTKQRTGAALDIRLHTTAVSGQEGINALVALMKGFDALGGFFMQIDVADAEILRKAQEEPENYRSLSVRVSGWNARFVTLNKEWQDMVIGQAENSR